MFANVPKRHGQERPNFLRQIFLLPQAVEDLDLIYEPVYSQILHKIRMLAQFPEMGPAMEGHFAGYRYLTVNPFRILYRLIGNSRIEIAYIMHYKRGL